MACGYPPTPLSTARINRLLRPLRNRCSALSAFGAIQSVSTATYSTTKNFTQPSIPPLCILPSPESSNRLDATSYELSKKIYAVYNAMKDIVEKTEEFRTLSEGKGPSRIPSLSTLCCLVIGQHVDPEIEEDVTILEEAQSVDVVDSLYDEIPTLYRGSILVSHAMHIILSECPPIPTLLKLLLDITLDNKLHYHSEILLRRLLSVALSPPTTTRPPSICHPAHSNFLIECLGRWEQKSNLSSSFFSIFNDVMVDVESYDAWSCKAITKLLLYNCRKKPFRVGLVSCNLVRFIANPELHLPSRQFSLMSRSSPAVALRRSLRLWLEWVLRFLLLSIQSLTVDIVQDTIYDFLRTCKECWGYLSTPDLSATVLSSPEQDVSSLIVSISTLLLSRGLGTESDEALLLIQILEKIQQQPSTTMFFPLISQTMTLSAHLPDFKEQIESHASSLREHGFLQLEASLWASTLKEVESLDAALLSRYDKGALHEYSCALIERVEEAEHRCYANSPNSSSIQQQRRGWDWDEAFGCWTVAGEHELTPKQQKKRPHSPCCSLHTSPCSEISETESGTPPKKRPRLIPRASSSSSFTSLLSNALSNRVVLHEYEDEATNRQPTESDDSDVEDDTAAEDLSTVFPSSDDLNLFAYAMTSPVRS
ncbi:hypothetical protein BT96DRAFT_1018086 [Gymnopus androsaceus JB14]|uniref:Uncharacterized protein n=1 Tax=Gymnopus androsaceus JB14 TaxID=1447944 RepID=A0A6A4HTW0_9AGAR|nr:hypothetical protein BT96DRAFT_1018086 [Gymnopus androsaceus JB14]